jgi:hypothetical protein
MDARERVLDVDSGCHGEGEGHVAAAAQDLWADCGSQLREQDGDRRRRGGRHGVWPERFDQLVTGDWAVAIERQVGEEKPTLAAWETTFHPTASELDDE